jgi:Alginate lyase
VDAIGLLKGAASWTAADQAGMEKWMADFLVWMQTSKNGKDEMNAKNNHGVWYDAQRLSFALFTHNQALAKDIVSNLQRRMDAQMNEDGFFPAELARTMSLHYSVFVLEPFFITAQMAKHTNSDLWNYKSPSGKSLQKAFTAIQPYLVQDKKWEGQQIKEFDFTNTIPLLMQGKSHYSCSKCTEAINRMAGKDANKLRIHLLTNSDL